MQDTNEFKEPTLIAELGPNTGKKRKSKLLVKDLHNGLVLKEYSYEKDVTKKDGTIAKRTVYNRVFIPSNKINKNGYPGVRAYKGQIRTLLKDIRHVDDQSNLLDYIKKLIETRNESNKIHGAAGLTSVMY